MTPIRLNPKDIPIRRLAELWQAGKLSRDDAHRDDKVLRWLVTDPSVHWYQGSKNSLWYLTDQNDSIRSATLNILADNVWTFRNVTPFLTKLMELEQLRKLYGIVPSPALMVKRILKLVGFRHEGALKQGVKFDGRFVTLEIFGLLLEEVERNAKAWTNSQKKASKKGKRPHARKGRPRWKVKKVHNKKSRGESQPSSGG